MNLKLLIHGTLVILVMGLNACAAIRPYEKEYLLSPLMDDAVVSTLQPAFAKSASTSQERLASGTAGNGGTSCPTCGG
jgi:hypothetical protein